jgi:6-pyruvoyltetrahydropterin/6-carboxytetrahydropterin synthase
VDFMRGILPTTENIVHEFWNIIQPILKDKYGIELHKLRLVETPNQSVEYFG